MCQLKLWCQCLSALLNFSCTFILLSVSSKCYFCIGKAASVRKAGMLVVLLGFIVVHHSDLNVPYSNATVVEELCL